MPRITLVIHNLPDKPAYPTVSTVRPTPTNHARTLASPAATERRTGKHRLEEPTVLGLADRVLTSWPITLRLALLTVVLLTGTAVMAAVIGVGGQLLLAALSIQARRERRQRVAALHQKQAASDEFAR